MKNKQLFFTLAMLLLAVYSVIAQTARVQVIHNSPDPTVDVYAGPTILLDDFAFRTASEFVDVPAGIPIPIGVAPASSTSVADVIFSQTVTFEAGKTYVVSASGVVFNATTPFGLVANDAARENATNAAKVDLAVFHGSPDAPAVDIAVRGVGNVINGLAYGSYSPYLSVDPGVYYFDVKAAGSSAIVQTYKADLNGLAGKALTVFASGYLTPGVGVPFGLFAALSDGTVVELPTAAVAQVQVIHNSPSPTVDVWANEDRLIDDFVYRTATPYIFVPAGVNINLGIALDNSVTAAEAIANFDVTLENGKTYIVTASGIVGNTTTPFTLNVNADARPVATANDKVDVAVLHGSPDAPAVDVDEFLLGNVIADLAYGEFTPYLSLNPGIYDFSVRAAGTSTTVGMYRANLSGLAGKSAYVFASGLLGDPATPFNLMAALADGTVLTLPVTPTTRLQVVHNSPDPTVDVYGGATKLIDDFAFRTATPFINIPTGISIPVGVAPAGSASSAEAIFTQNVTFDAGKTYIVTASGVVFNTTTPFTLIANDNGREAATNPAKVDVAVLHGSPDAPAVDVAVRGVGNVITNLAYGQFTPYLNLDPGVYYLDVKAAGSSAIVQTYRADLSALAGKALYVFASGYLTPGVGVPFGLFAALNDGTVVALPTAAVAQVQVIHNSPSPTVDVWANEDRLIDDFEYRTATEFVFVPAGVDINLGVALSNSTAASEAIANFNVNLENGKTYIVTASGIVGNTATPFTLNVNPNGQNLASATDKVDVAVLHGATDAPAVDVAARGVGDIITNLAYGEFTPYLSLDPAVYYLDVKAAGSSAIVQTYRADLSGLAGKSAYVFASGFLAPGAGEPAFGLFAALADGTVIALPVAQFAKVQVIHNSPSPVVDVWANETRLLDDFAYRTATPFVELEAGVDINLGVATGSSLSASEAIFNQVVNLEANRSYIVTASGIVGNTTTPFNLNINADARETATNPTKVDVAVLHGSPDAPAVDVDEALTGNVITNLAYGEFTPYLSLDPGVYDFAVRATGTSPIVQTYRANLSALAGKSAYVFASGLLTNPNIPFNLMAALADGTVLLLPVTPLARVQVIHNSPSPTVDVYAGNLRLIDNFAFRTATPFVNLPANRDFSIGIALDNSTTAADAIATFPVNLDDDKKYTVFVAGVVGNATTPFNLYVFDDALEGAASGFTATSVFHGSPDAPAVDVDERLAGELVANLAFGEATPYLNLPSSTYIIDVKVAGTETIAASFEADLSGLDAQAIRVFASGNLAGSPDFGLFAALANGTVVELPAVRLARVQIIHNSPTPTVDVYINEEPAIDDFEFRTATEFIYFPADGIYTVGVAPGSSQGPADIIAEFDLDLENGKSYYVIASGIVGNATTPFTILVQEGAKEEAENPDVLEVMIHHGIPDAPAVDLVEAFSQTTALSGLTFGQFTPYVPLQPAVNIFDIVPTAAPATVVGTYGGNFEGLDGIAALAMASGTLGGSAYGLFLVLSDGTVIEFPSFARGQVIHNAPSPTVDVYFNEDQFLDDFAFRTATPTVFLPAKTPFELAVAPASSTSVGDAIYQLPVTGLQTGKFYTIMAAGEVGGTPGFGLFVNENARFRAENTNSVDVAFFHGAPNAPEVDITAAVGVLFDNVNFGEFGNNLSVPPADYVVNVTPANDNNTIVASYRAELSTIGGQFITVFASGYLNNTPNQPEFGAWAALTDGTVFPLPIVVSTSNPDAGISNVVLAPNPATEMINVQLDLDNSNEVRFRLFDGTGRLVQEGEWGTLNAGRTVQTLQVGTFTTGMYQLELLTKTGRQTLRFVKN